MEVAQITWSSPENLNLLTGGSVMWELHAGTLSVGEVPRRY